jgi:hypothetical protein
MLSYLNHLNRNRAEGDPDNPTVHRAAKAIAWCCIRTTFRSGQGAAKKDVGSLMAQLSADPTVLAYLETRLRLLRTISPEETKIRFDLDPLEEYLAALHQVELRGNDKKEWLKFFAMADKMPDAPEKTQGFLRAVYDCCAARKSEFKIPDSVFQGLAERTGLSTAS